MGALGSVATPLGQPAPVDDELRPRAELVARQVQRQVGNFRRIGSSPQRRVPQEALAVGFEAGDLVEHHRVDWSRMDAVDPDVVAAPLAGGDLGHPAHGKLAGGVGD